jgi:glycerol kinase
MARGSARSGRHCASLATRHYIDRQRSVDTPDTTPTRIARATLEANAFQTYAMIEKTEVLAGVGGFEVVLPEMRKSTAPAALGSALLAASAVGLFGWDITRPETFVDIKTARSTPFEPRTTPEKRSRAWRGALAGVEIRNELGWWWWSGRCLPGTGGGWVCGFTSIL